MNRAIKCGGLSVVLALAAAGCAVPAGDGGEVEASRADALTGVCAGAATVQGIDTSQWQGPIDWTKVKQSGKAFAIARVSDGTGFPDGQFSTDWPAIKAAGMIRGAYQFFRPGEDPLAQADLFVGKLSQFGAIGPGDLPPILDIEATDGEPAAVVVARMTAWLARVQQGTGRRPMIYTASFMSSVIGTSFSAYPLWVANYQVTCPHLPAGWSQWAFWQSGDAGSVPGIAGGVDVDVFNGTLGDLQAFAAGGGGNGIAWSCAASAYQGAQLWTCSGGNLFECQGGAAVEHPCQLGCASMPLGKEDRCVSSAPGWSCAASAYQGAQLWTCSGGSLFRCAGAVPETIACPGGCVSNAVGTNDACK